MKRKLEKKAQMKSLNRIKVILVEKKRTNVWLAKELNVTVGTVSKWCRNVAQPSLEMLFEIARVLDVNVHDLIERSKD